MSNAHTLVKVSRKSANKDQFWAEMVALSVLAMLKEGEKKKKLMDPPATPLSFNFMVINRYLKSMVDKNVKMSL